LTVDLEIEINKHFPGSDDIGGEDEERNKDSSANYASYLQELKEEENVNMFLKDSRNGYSKIFKENFLINNVIITLLPITVAIDTTRFGNVRVITFGIDGTVLSNSMCMESDATAFFIHQSHTFFLLQSIAKIQTAGNILTATNIVVMSWGC
jgi:hypothetical protein